MGYFIIYLIPWRVLIGIFFVGGEFHDCMAGWPASENEVLEFGEMEVDMFWELEFWYPPYKTTRNKEKT